MSAELLVEQVKLGGKGKLKLPKKVRRALGVSKGDCVAFLVEDGAVRIVNADACAQAEPQCEAEEEQEETGAPEEPDEPEIAEQPGECAGPGDGEVPGEPAPDAEP